MNTFIGTVVRRCAVSPAGHHRLARLRALAAALILVAGLFTVSAGPAVRPVEARGGTCVTVSTWHPTQTWESYQTWVPTQTWVSYPPPGHWQYGGYWQQGGYWQYGGYWQTNWHWVYGGYYSYVTTCPPDAPTSVAATAFNQSAVVSWSQPYHGGSPITNYTVTSVPASAGCSTSSLSCAISGLTNGTPYTFSVAAWNVRGDGYPSQPSDPVTPAPVPDAPTAVTAVRGVASATVSWSAPASNNGFAITRYTVTSSPSDRACSTTGALSCAVPGLTNGTAYTFTVTATNSKGTGPASAASNSVTPATVPDAPTSLSAYRADASASVWWLPPAFDGGSPITGYSVLSSPGGLTCATAGYNGCTVTGLTNGTPYTFTVTATNDMGTGAASVASDPVTPIAVPGRATAVTATRGNLSAHVVWTAPASAGGSAIVAYTVTSDPASAGCSTTGSRSCNITGLTNGTPYSFVVYAINGVGTGPGSDPSNTITPATRPGAPTGATASTSSAGAGGAYVSWTAPADDGGSPVTGYTVTSAPDSLTCSAGNSGGSGSPGVDTHCTVTGLTVGTPYTFTVTATNDAGTGHASAATSSVTPLGTPSAPLSPLATPGNGSVLVSWTTPSSDGGSAITGYSVTSTPDNQTCSPSGTDVSCNVTGLTNGTPYTFSVTATNSIGTGPAATVSATPALVATVPGAPQSITAVGGDAQAVVSWQAPGDNGGRPITRYTVTSTPDNLHCTTTTSLTCTVTGLTNGKEYTFTVVAKNSVGTGSASSASDGVFALPAGNVIVSGQTVSGRIDPASDTDEVFFDGVAGQTATIAENGDFDTYLYLYRPLPDGTELAHDDDSGDGSNSLISVTLPVTGRYRILADNYSSGVGSYTLSLTLSPVAAPGAPTDVTATPGGFSAVVSWSAPVDDGGSPITGYTATATPDGATCSTTGALTCEVVGLTAGTTYTFQVTAANGFGTSALSDASGGVVPLAGPGAPTGVTAVARAKSATVSWSAPSSDGGSPITGYTATSDPGGFTCTTGALTCTVVGLTAGTPYAFTVQATTDVATGPASAPSASVVPYGVPDVPTGVTATAGNASAVVSWLAPANNGGKPVTRYTVTSTPDTLYCTTTTSLSCTVTGLTNGTEYTFKVVAKNAAGTGSASDASTGVTPGLIPGAPTSVTAVGDNASATVSWTAPDDGGSPITGYAVTSSPGGLTCSTTGALTCDVSGLTNGQVYTFSVQATNDAGTGLASDDSNSVTPVTTPGVPVGVTATRANVSSLISWSAPTDDGGSPVIGYNVVSSPEGKTCSTHGLHCTVTGLTNGTTYTFNVTAITAVGPGEHPGVSNPISPAAVPDAPTGLLVVRGNASAVVSWTAPAANGRPILGYTVTSNPGATGCAMTTALSCNVTGLTNGLSYTFTVTATNVIGKGPASSISAGVTPATVPGAPASVTATGNDGAAVVSWTAPASNGGSAITLYTATSSVGGMTCTSAGTTCTVTGLTNDQLYTFTVRATNDVGQGPSTRSNAVTPARATKLVVSTATSWVAGAAHSITVTAKDAASVVATGYTGTIHFTSSDPAAVLPADYTFTPADKGVHTFTGGLILKTAGTRSVTATDKTTASIAGSQGGLVVSAAAVKAFTLVTANPWVAGASHSVTITAKDAYGNTVTGYAGTVHLTSSDPAAVLPANYTFVAADAGIHKLTVRLNTAGSRSITATDTVTATITGTQTITVS